MSKTISPKKLIRLLLQKGFVFERQKGSHAVYFRQGDNVVLVVAMHNKDIPTGTLRKIMKTTGLTKEDF
jgi:predicted RNA binding protein YcfA (HicA-like mRNA interferase family)